MRPPRQCGADLRTRLIGAAGPEGSAADKDPLQLASQPQLPRRQQLQLQQQQTAKICALVGVAIEDALVGNILLLVECHWRCPSGQQSKECICWAGGEAWRLAAEPNQRSRYVILWRG